LLINNGADPTLVAERLGHKDVRMTLNIYSHMFPN
jgi:site-specific recombinase XerD